MGVMASAPIASMEEMHTISESIPTWKLRGSLGMISEMVCVASTQGVARLGVAGMATTSRGGL